MSVTTELGPTSVVSGATLAPPARAWGRDFPMIPMAILGIIGFVALFADFLAPHDPQVGSLPDRFLPPFWYAKGSMAHIFGTDHLGRDVLSRLIFGARVSMIVGFTAVIVSGVIGTTLGIISGYLGGWVIR